MTRIIGSRKLLLLAAALFAALLTISQGASAAKAQDVAAAVRAKLNKSQYKDVQVSVDANGIATLSGTVGLYEYKSDADKTVHKVKGVAAVRNDIAVSGPSVPDSQMQKNLAEKLAYDRVGYGNVFDAITVQVQDGVVTLGGHAHDYPNRDSALGLVATTPGVKDVIDNIEVDPVSQMDWQTRMAVARAIYSFPSLNRYAIDPEMPIRISVQNGHVELYGMVDSEADKEAAFIRANGVPGVFSVKNYLQVANQPGEKQN
ncbi:MAG: BON domain-containing protein [Terracidiphilus sp.]